MNPHRTNDPALRAEHIAKQAGQEAFANAIDQLNAIAHYGASPVMLDPNPMQAYFQAYDQAIIEIAGNTNSQHKGE